MFDGRFASEEFDQAKKMHVFKGAGLVLLLLATLGEWKKELGRGVRNDSKVD